jgi:hypothetical protein
MIFKMIAEKRSLRHRLDWVERVITMRRKVTAKVLVASHHAIRTLNTRDEEHPAGYGVRSKP